MEKIEVLYNRGYRMVSRKYREATRVDISDEDMVKMFIKNNFGDADSGVPSGSLESQRNFYRRVYSRDKVTLDNEGEVRELLRLTNERSY